MRGYDFYQAFKRQQGDQQASIKLIRGDLDAALQTDCQHGAGPAQGRRCEIYDINGVVCETGRKCGIPTPVNDVIVKVVAGIQDGKYEYSPRISSSLKI